MQLTVLLLFTVYSVLIHTLPHTHAYTHNHTSLLYHFIPPHHYVPRIASHVIFLRIHFFTHTFGLIKVASEYKHATRTGRSRRRVRGAPPRGGVVAIVPNLLVDAEAIFNGASDG